VFTRIEQPHSRDPKVLAKLLAIVPAGQKNAIEALEAYVATTTKKNAVLRYDEIRVVKPECIQFLNEKLHDTRKTPPKEMSWDDWIDCTKPYSGVRISVNPEFQSADGASKGAEIGPQRSISSEFR
jgi:hypothetical protein